MHFFQITWFFLHNFLLCETSYSTCKKRIGCKILFLQNIEIRQKWTSMVHIIIFNFYCFYMSEIQICRIY